jgi:hypothetical protein
MQAPSSRDVAGVAIGFAALVDSRVNRILSTDGKYEDVKDIDLAKWVRENIGLPTRIENDARMALLGESYAGAALGFTDVVMMTLGTGIGGVAMIEGKLLRGKHAQAGCLGGAHSGSIQWPAMHLWGDWLRGSGSEWVVTSLDNKGLARSDKWRVVEIFKRRIQGAF